MTPAKFRKKPVVIEAMQYTAATCRWIAAWVGNGHDNKSDDCGVAPVFINTREGMMQASPGDWIIKGVAGEFYPCKPDIFAATYDAVHEENT